MTEGHWFRATRAGLLPTCARVRLAAISLALLLAPCWVRAQQSSAPNDVIQHYRAYRDALEHGNLQLAETEAASALAASVRQYGDGGRTAVLAVNLAGVRLTLKEHAAALEPARQALAIAEAQGEKSGVDARVARLLLGRAELPGGGAAAQDRLLQAIADAQGVPGIEGEAYPAAAELGAAAYASGRYLVSREAWAASTRFAGGSPVNADYARAIARIGEAEAGFRQLEKHPKQPSTGSRLGESAGSTQSVGNALTPAQQFAQIDAMLAEAMDLLHDQAMAGPAGGELTLAQAAYGQAGAWKGVLNAKLTSEGRQLSATTQPQKTFNEIGAAADPRPMCKVRWVMEPTPKFPTAKRYEGGVGSVVLKILVDEAGKVVRVQVAGSVGGQSFMDSVVEAARQWHLEKDASSQPSCRMSGEFFGAVHFVLHD